MPDARFLSQLTLAILLLGAGFSALVLAPATLPDIQALDRITQHLDWHIRPVTGLELFRTRLVLLILVAWTSIQLLLSNLRPSTRRDWQQFGRELQQIGRSLLQAFRGLTRPQRGVFWLLFGLLTCLRLYFSLTKPLHGEEVASYEFFVRPGLLASSAYYPVPNNHVLSNTVSGWFYLLHPAFWWCMRLPVLLFSTVGSLLWFALLQRRAGFRVAAVATFLFNWLQLSLYLASTGRGYWLLICLSGIVFFSTLELSARQSKYRYAAWAGLLAGGVLGMYTVPTFAYLLVSAFSWLGVVYLRQRRQNELGYAALLGMSILLGTVLLYTPLNLISGFEVLTGNGFVAPRAPAEFWQGLLATTWFNEGFLAGQRSIGAVLVLAVLALVAWLLSHRALPSRFHPLLHRLGWPALWFSISPYALILAQRVFPPERVLLYKAVFLFLLLALLLEWWLRRPLPPALARWSRGILLGAALVFAAYQTYTVERYSRSSRPSLDAFEAAFRWLAAQKPGPVLAPPPVHNLFFRFYGHRLTPDRTWRFDAQARPGQRYTYLVTAPADGPPLPGYGIAFQNADVIIYQPKP